MKKLLRNFIIIFVILLCFTTLFTYTRKYNKLVSDITPQKAGINIGHIRVSLLENGQEIVRSNTDTSVGTILANFSMELIPGKKYEENLSIKNSGETQGRYQWICQNSNL